MQALRVSADESVVGVRPGATWPEADFRAWQSRCIFLVAEGLRSSVWLLDDWIATRHRTYREFQAFADQELKVRARSRPEGGSWFRVGEDRVLHDAMMLSCKPGDYVVAFLSGETSPADGDPLAPTSEHILATTTAKASDLRFRWRRCRNKSETLELLGLFVGAAIRAMTLPSMKAQLEVVAEVRLDTVTGSDDGATTSADFTEPVSG